MKCVNCDFTHEENFDFCPQCGAPSELNFAERIRGIVTSNGFLAICVLVTAATALSLFAKSINIIYILLSVFLWLSYSAAKSGGNFGEQLRNVSGTVYAQYVIMNVASIIVMVCGVISAGLSILVGALPIEELKQALADSVTIDVPFEIPEITAEIAGIVVLVMGIVFVIIGVLMLIINVLSYKNIHRFAKSVYQSVLSGTAVIEKTTTAKNWLLVLGIFGAISAVTSIFASPLVALGTGCSAAAMFVAVWMINKYLTK